MAEWWESAPVVGASPDLYRAVETVESGGNPAAVSAKGARGPMQTMPGTLRDPGFGVRPATDPDDPVEQTRVGRDYLDAMIRRYGDRDTGLMAYNWGPGNVDRWIAAGRPPEAVPDETRAYVPKIDAALSRLSDAKPADGEWWTDAPVVGEEPAGKPGFWESAKSGWIGGLFGTNPKMAGTAAQIIGRKTGLDPLVGLGEEMATYGDKELAKYQPTVPSFVNIQSFDDLAAYLGYGGGQAMASTVPSIAAGGATALATANPFLGFIVGGSLPSYVQNLGDVGEGLQQELAGDIKTGKITQDAVDTAALLAAVPMAALDVVSLGGILAGGVTKPAKDALKRNLVRTLATSILKGATIEGLTEGMQEVVSQWTQAHMGKGDYLAKERLTAVIDNAILGSLPGAVLGPVGAGVGGKRPGDETRKPPPAETPPPADEEAAAEAAQTAAMAAASVSPDTGVAEIDPALMAEMEEAPEIQPAPAGKTSTPEEIAAAAARVEPEPTPAQAEADNYRQGPAKFRGLDLSIETPQGGTRRDTKNDPPQWEVEDFPAHYGKIKGTTAADGEQIDFFLGDALESDRVFVIDQMDPETGAFDEHKVMLGFPDEAAALDAYSGAFTDGSGPDRVQGVTEMPVAEFKDWIKGNTTASLTDVSRETTPQKDEIEPTEPEKAPQAPVEPAGDESVLSGAQVPPEAETATQRPAAAQGGAVQPDMLGGPAISETEMVRREQATAYLDELRAEDLSDKEITGRLDEEIDNLEGLHGTAEKVAMLKEARRIHRPMIRIKTPMKEEAPAEVTFGKLWRDELTRAGKFQLAQKAGFDQAASERISKTDYNHLDPRVEEVLARAIDKAPKPFNEYGHYKGERVEVRDNNGNRRYLGTVYGPSQRGGVLVTADGDTTGGHRVVDNPLFVVGAPKADPRKSPKIKVTKAAIIPTRGGVVTVPIEDARERQRRENVEKMEAREKAETAKAKPSPVSRLADAYLARLNTWTGPREIPWRVALDMAEKEFGGTLAEGAFTSADMYEAQELALNRWVLEGFELDPDFTAKDAKNVLFEIRQEIERLPTQTRRGEETDTFQQFSTPPDYAFLAAWLANIRKGDLVLEPSAGTGSLAAPASLFGPREIVTNELSERRRAILEALGLGRVFKEDAAQINNILPKDIRPDTVVMNPPFSQTAGRAGADPMTGAKHIEQALKRLKPGGRLVAIVGRGMAPGRPTFRGWWTKIQAEYTVRANLGIPGEIYRKYGTTFDTRLLVIDKTGPTADAAQIVAPEEVESLAMAVDLLEDVRNARAAPSERAPAEPEGGRAPAPSRPEPAGQRPIQRPTDEVEPGSRPARPAGEVPGGRVDDGRAPAGERAGQGAPVAVGRPEPGGGAAKPGRPERPEPAGGEQPAPGKRPSEDAGTAPGLPAGEPGVESLRVETRESEAESEDITDSLYEPYKPQRLQIPGAKPHPGALVQSAAMAAVFPPKPTYAPKLPKALIEQGKLSLAQLEAVTYAGQQHEQFLQHGEGETPVRRGFFIADGTGVGKGREVSGIIQDNINQGRKKHVWVSANRRLINDAKRDFAGIGGDPKRIMDLGSTKMDSDIKATSGIMFTTYDTMASVPQKKKEGDEVAVRSRLQQLVDWLGADFDGVIAFDEAHFMGNAIDIKGKRGVKKAAKRALAGVELQKLLPSARVVYVSATGATEVENLSYAERLGLWGRGTPFATKRDFISKIKAGGIAAMELVARDLKAMGRYISRSLSFDGVEYDRLEHKLTKNQREMYDEFAGAWQIVLENINEALKITEAKGDSRTVAAAMAQFWGAHQRFFNQVMTSLQMPSVLKQVAKDLEDGNSAVLQLVNTMEAAQERALGRVESEEDLETLDITPREALMQYVENAFPVWQYETFIDESGNEQSRQVVDSEGNPVENEDAVRLRDELLEKLGALRVPDGPIDQIVNHFGEAAVAEVTGRKRRLIWAEVDGVRKRVEQKRGSTANVVEANAFQGGKKRILVFSDAGGTGRSYHADRTTKNQQRRVHYLLQPGWRADNAVQGFGRTHRTNQASAPFYRLVTTDLKGQKRFISSIARRLDQLGALTKGQRQTGGQGLFAASDNLESQYATDALRRLIYDIAKDEVPGMSLSRFEKETGLALRDKTTGALKAAMPPITQFLNRLLSMTVDLQNRVFGEFEQRLIENVERAIAAGKLDVGVETLKADRIKKLSEQVVYTHAETGAETKAVKLQLGFRNHPRSWEAAMAQVTERSPEGPEFFVLSKKSGRIYMATKAGNHTDDKGVVIPQVRLLSHMTYEYIDAPKLSNKDYWDRVGEADARAGWEKQVAATPEFHEREETIITGLILPIWDRLPGQTRIYRLQTDQGERMLGRVIPPEGLQRTLERLGATADAPQLTPAQAAGRVLRQGDSLKLANDWTIRRSRVAGEWRIEIKGPGYNDLQQIKADGVFTERINYETRYFVPAGAEAGKVLARIIEHRPIVEVRPVTRGVEGDADLAIVPEFTEAFTGDRAKIVARIKEIARQILPDAKVRTVDELFADIGGRRVRVGGAHVAAENLITVALGYGDPVHFVRHELVHALRAMGGFTEAEWTVLERKAGEWRAKHNIDQMYGHLDEAGRNEEAIARAFAEYRAGTQFPPGLRRIFERIAQFLRRLGNTLRGFGYQSVDDIFERIESGGIGRREPGVASPPRKVSYAIAEDDAVTARLTQAQMDDLARMESRIGEAPRGVGEKLSDWVQEKRSDEGLVTTGLINRMLERFTEAVADDLRAINLMERLTNEGELLEQGSAARLAYTSRGTNDVIASVMMDGAPVWREGVVQINNDIPSPMQLVQRIGDRHQAYRLYAVGLRAKELLAQGRERVFDDEMIAAAERLGEVYPDFAEIHTDMQRFNGALLDFVQASGRISPESRAIIDEMNKNYVPFWRLFEGKTLDAKTKRGFAGQHPAIWRLRGGLNNIDDPLLTWERNIHRLIEGSVKNVVMLRAEQINARAGGVFMRRIGRKVKKALVSRRQMIDDLRNLGFEVSAADNLSGDDLTMLWSFGHAPKGPNIVSHMRGGQVVYHEVHDPMLLRAFTALGSEAERHPLIKILMIPKKILTTAVTVEPTFLFRNASRDTFHAAVVNHIGFRPIYDTLRGMYSFWVNDEHAKAFFAGGAGFSSLIDTGGFGRHRMIEQRLRRGTVKGYLIDTPARILKAITKIEQGFEYGTRIGAFRRLREKGARLDEAIWKSRESATDFAMHGNSKLLRFFTDTVPFLNAGIQGLYRTGRGATENPAAFAFKGLLITAAGLALYLYNRDDERFQALEEWERDMYWWAWLPDGTPIKWPRMFEVGAIFGTVPERALEAMIEGNGERLVGRLAWNTQEMFRLDPVPAGLKGPLRLYSNWDEFRERPIVPDYLETVRPTEQFDSRTSLSAIAVGRATGTSPKKIENVVEGIFGAMGTYALTSIDLLMQAGGDYPVSPDGVFDQYRRPVVRGFVGRKVPFNTRYVTQFYEMRDEANKLYGSMQHLIGMGEYERAKDLIKENRGPLAAREAFNTVAAQMSKLSKVMQMIRQDRYLSGDEKRDRIDSLTLTRNRLAEISERLKPLMEQ